MSSPVEQIKSRLGIAEVVQSYIKLQKAGINLRASCPFHNEKTPSFFVSPSRESWHCFGCQKGGDIFSFVMEIEGVEFPEALRILANRAGVELAPISPKQIDERARLAQILEDSRAFYEAELKKNQNVISYLKERGLKGETAKMFGIGFAPDGWRNLRDFLAARGFSDSEMEKAGMVIKSEKGYYDRFRSRIMFPLNNSSGQIVGFSGRIFNKEDDKMGKYINTPQTILYDKSRILYGFDKAKLEIRKKDVCVLVEGQMDVIMSHQAGFLNTVAVSGTALTTEHLKIIKRLTDKLVMAFDKDEAGFGASKSGINLGLSSGFEIKAAIVPSGKDPADTIKENPEKWEEALKNSVHIIQFYLDSLKDGEKEIERLVLPYISLIPNAIEKAHWVKETAKKLFVSEEPVWEELKKMESLAPEIGFQEYEKKQKQTKPRLRLLEDRLLGFLLWQKNSDDKELKSEIENIIQKYGFDLDKENTEAEKLVFEAELFYNNSESMIEELGKLSMEFEREKTKNALEEITADMRRMEASGDEKGLRDCLDKFNKLSKKLNELK